MTKLTEEQLDEAVRAMMEQQGKDLATTAHHHTEDKIQEWILIQNCVESAMKVCPTEPAKEGER